MSKTTQVSPPSPSKRQQKIPIKRKIHLMKKKMDLQQIDDKAKKKTLKLREKYCPHCKKHKKVNQFYPNIAQRDGLDTKCQECALELQKFINDVKACIMRLWFEGKKCHDCEETATRVLH